MQKKKPEIVRRTVKYRLNAKYAPEIFCPSNAIENAFWQRDEDVDPLLVTTDGKVCVPKFIRTTNNESGRYDEDFDYLCKRHFSASFSSVRSIWYGRLDWLDNYWHLIELKEV